MLAEATCQGVKHGREPRGKPVPSDASIKRSSEARITHQRGHLATLVFSLTPPGRGPPHSHPNAALPRRHVSASSSSMARRSHALSVLERPPLCRQSSKTGSVDKTYRFRKVWVARSFSSSLGPLSRWHVPTLRRVNRNFTIKATAANATDDN